MHSCMKIHTLHRSDVAERTAAMLQGRIRLSKPPHEYPIQNSFTIKWRRKKSQTKIWQKTEFTRIYIQRQADIWRDIDSTQNIHEYQYICIYVYKYVNICIYIYIYVCICIYICSYIYIYICIYMWTCVWVLVCEWMYVCACACVYMYIHIFMHKHTRICVHTLLKKANIHFVCTNISTFTYTDILITL